MSNWPALSDGAPIEALYTVASGSSQIDVTSDGVSANTKGPYVEFIASTARNYAGLMVSFQTFVKRDWLVDVAIGAAGSEQIIIRDLRVGSAAINSPSLFIPVAVAAGSRIAVRAQCSSGLSLVITLGIHGISQSFLGFSGASKCIAIGEDTSTSRGTSVDAGAVADTKGAWAELVASVGNCFSGITVIWGGNGNPTMQAANFIYDIAVGAAGSEVVIVPDGGLNTTSTENVSPLSSFVPVTIQTGSRISARIQSSITDVTDRILDVTLCGHVT